MDGKMLAAYGAALVATAIFLFTFWQLRIRRRPNLPPGPTPWPVIGNLNLLGALPHRTIRDLARSYGPIMHLRLGSHRAVVASTADAARLFLQTHDLNFASRPRTAAGNHTAYGFYNMTWSPYDPYWRQARRFYVDHLSGEKPLDSFESVRSQEVRSLVRSLASDGGEKPLVLREYFWRTTLGIVCRMAFGRKYADGDAGRPDMVSSSEFRDMLDELFLLNGVYVLGDFVPWLGFLDVDGYVGRMKAVARKLDSFVERALDEHQAAAATPETEGWCVVDGLLQLADDPGVEVKLTRDQVKALTVEVIAAATESSSLALEWAMSELLKHPHVLHRATQEVDGVVGKDRMVEERDARNMPYIQAVVKETMRMHPASPILTPHLCRQDTIVSGYHMPKGTRLLVNVWAIQNDPGVWEAPEEFRPERFLEEKAGVDLRGQNFELLPFGTGRRICPGMNLGLKVVWLSLASILHAFRWELPAGVSPSEVGMEEVLGMTLKRKVQIQAVAVPRLEPHVYQL